MGRNDMPDVTLIILQSGQLRNTSQAGPSVTLAEGLPRHSFSGGGLAAP